MNRSAASRFIAMACSLLALCSARAMADNGASSPDARYAVGEVLASDDFAQGTGQWRAELQSGGKVEARDGALDIDVPGGCSVWYAKPFEGPLLITYEATVLDKGGPNDRVSDLNCFWMADDSRSPGELFATHRTGKFSDYDRLRCYYVGLGGNTNSTTRFRRYIGEAGNRPLLPQHDLTDQASLLVPNATQTVQIIAAGPVIEYYRDGHRLFSYDDPQPYTRGWFAFRTVHSHTLIRHFRVYRLKAK